MIFEANGKSESQWKGQNSAKHFYTKLTHLFATAFKSINKMCLLLFNISDEDCTVLLATT